MTDWFPLAEDDPMPGEPGGLAELVRVLQADAEQIRGAVGGLRAVNTEEFWQGESAETFTARRDRVIPDLDSVALRIEEAAGALGRFVPAMADCHSRGRTAVLRAREAQGEIIKASSALEDEGRQAAAAQAAADAWPASHPGQPPPRPQATWGVNWQGIFDEAQEERAAAARLFAEAVHDYHQAAHRCAHDLGEAIHDRLRDHHGGGGLFGGIGRAIGAGARVVSNAAEGAAKWTVEHFPALEATSEILGVASAVAGLAGLQPLALGLSAAKTATDLTLALAGEKDWKAVRDDALGFALFGVGRIATGMARARAGANASRRLSETRQEMKALTAARAAKAKAGIKESAELGSVRSARLRGLRQQEGVYRPLVKELRNDSATPFWHQSRRVMQHLEFELPRQAMLGFGHDVTVLGTTARGIKLYGQQKKISNLAEQASSVFPTARENQISRDPDPNPEREAQPWVPGR